MQSRIKKAVPGVPPLPLAVHLEEGCRRLNRCLVVVTCSAIQSPPKGDGVKPVAAAAASGWSTGEIVVFTVGIAWIIAALVWPRRTHAGPQLAREFQENPAQGARHWIATIAVLAMLYISAQIELRLAITRHASPDDNASEAAPRPRFDSSNGSVTGRFTSTPPILIS